jgi:hypothetical protein
MKILPFWEYRYPMSFAGIRAAVGLWLVILGSILCSMGYYWGGPLVLAAAALSLWISYQLLQMARS